MRAGLAAPVTKRPGHPASRHSCGPTVVAEVSADTEPKEAKTRIVRIRPAGRKESTTCVTRTRAAPDGPADALLRAIPEPAHLGMAWSARHWHTCSIRHVTGAEYSTL